MQALVPGLDHTHCTINLEESLWNWPNKIGHLLRTTRFRQLGGLMNERKIYSFELNLRAACMGRWPNMMLIAF